MCLLESGSKTEEARQGLSRKRNPFAFSVFVSSCSVLEIRFDGELWPMLEIYQFNVIKRKTSTGSQAKSGAGN